MSLSEKKGKITMLERLIESWLDSASERSYQPAFVQILISQGYEILHNTRHAPMEFGKDVIARKEDGSLHAFQLKGNPGSRLTLTQFREIHPQLLELITFSLPLTGIGEHQHQSYLVTNGEVDEEVLLAIQSFNASLERKGFGEEPLKLWNRGHLLERARALGSDLWPLTVPNTRALLDMMAEDGRDWLPVNKIHGILLELLSLPSEEMKSKNEIQRISTSSSMIISLCLSPFYKENNHCAIIFAWIMYYFYIHALHEKNKTEISKATSRSLEAVREQIFDKLVDLLDECKSSPHLLEGDIWADCEFVYSRIGLLNGLFACCWFWNEREIRNAGLRTKLESFLPSTFGKRCLWGEGAVPALVAHYWYFSQRVAGIRSEMDLARLLQALLNEQLSEGKQGLASPYYGIDEVVQNMYSDILNYTGSLSEDNNHGSSYMAEALFTLLVRANMKQSCRLAWPAYSRILRREFRPQEGWQYCLVQTEHGTERSQTTSPTGYWADVTERARDCRCEIVPEKLRSDPVLLLLFCLFVPQRFTPEVCRLLGHKLSPIWFLNSEPRT